MSRVRGGARGLRVAHSVRGEYSALEYRVYVDDELEYVAGNSLYDSQVYVSREEGLGLLLMREFCMSTCQSIALEVDAAFDESADLTCIERRIEV